MLLTTPPEAAPPGADEAVVEPEDVVEPVPEDGRVGDVVLEGVQGRRAAVSLRGDVPIVIGTVLGFDDDGVGNTKIRRAKHYRKAFELQTTSSRSGGGLLLRGRF